MMCPIARNLKQCRVFVEKLGLLEVYWYHEGWVKSQIPFMGTTLIDIVAARTLIPPTSTFNSLLDDFQ